MQIINPSTNELISEITEDTTQIVESKFQRARGALSAWSLVPLEKRITHIQRFYELLEINKDTLARALTIEVGKPLQESYNEINGAKDRIKFFIDHAQKWLTTQEMKNDGNTADILAFDPLGVICNISAWNYPFLVGVNVFIPALLAGNTVLYKPSEFSTLIGLRIESLLHEAGIPEDVFIAVIGAAKTGEDLLNLPCDGYFFTGSFKTGQHIAQRVSSKLVPIGLELGGKDPLYVTDEIRDLSKVARAVAEGCFYNNGQSCCGVERLYVHEKVYDSFMNEFVAQTQKLKVGDPLSPENNQGPITRATHVSFLESQVHDAIKKGARLLAGGAPLEKKQFIGPTILADATHEMRIMTEESFGPLIGVMKVKDDAEAVRLMNDTDYGLTASVYCDDIDRAKTILSQIDVGTSYINCCDRVSPYLPWSGRKHSGLGMTLSFLGILAFARPRGWHIRRP